MAGAGSTYFQGKVREYQAAAATAATEAQTLGAKVTAASAALAILGKPTISQGEAETLIDLYTKAQ